MNMKNVIKNVMVAFVLLITVSAASAIESPVKVSVTGGKSIALFFGEISGKVWITFQDNEGTVFYSKRIKDLTSYSANYNLEAFPDGKYRLELVSTDRKLNIPVSIVDGTVTLKEEEMVAAPAISSRENMVAVAFSGKKESEWNVFIKDESGNVIFTEKVENGKKQSNRKYNLTGLNRGKYYFEFYSDGNSFTHSVVKN